MERGRRWYEVLEGAARARLAGGRSRGRGRGRAGERLERPDGRDRGEWPRQTGTGRGHASGLSGCLEQGRGVDETDTAGGGLEQVERLAVWNS